MVVVRSLDIKKKLKRKKKDQRLPRVSFPRIDSEIREIYKKIRRLFWNPWEKHREEENAFPEALYTKKQGASMLKAKRLLLKNALRHTFRIQRIRSRIGVSFSSTSVNSSRPYLVLRPLRKVFSSTKCVGFVETRRTKLFRSYFKWRGLKRSVPNVKSKYKIKKVTNIKKPSRSIINLIAKTKKKKKGKGKNIKKSGHVIIKKTFTRKV